jgi:hypothetical protein
MIHGHWPDVKSTNIITSGEKGTIKKMKLFLIKENGKKREPHKSNLLKWCCSRHVLGCRDSRTQRNTREKSCSNPKQIARNRQLSLAPPTCFSTNVIIHMASRFDQLHSFFAGPTTGQPVINLSLILSLEPYVIVFISFVDMVSLV